MNNRLPTVFVAMAALLAGAATTWSQASADKQRENLSRWRSVATVQLDGNVPAGGQIELELTGEAFAHARRDLADLRLTTPAGPIVPHTLRPAASTDLADEPTVTTGQFIAINTAPNMGVQAVADFSKALRKNRIEIATAGEDFLRHVRVEGSADGNSWQTLRRADWLFQVSHENGAYAKNVVYLPENDFRYVRVTVSRGPGDKGVPVISAIRTWQAKNAPPLPEAIKTAPDAANLDEDPNTGIVEIHIDLNYEKLPLRRVELAADTGNFLRRIEVLGRDRQTMTIRGMDDKGQAVARQIPEPWRSLGGGMIYRLGDGESTAVDLGADLSAGCRYLKIRLYPNKTVPAGREPDKPLKLAPPHVRVYPLRKFVTFRAAGPGPYTLYMGNARAAAPKSDDLPSTNPAPYVGEIARAHLGPVTANPEYALAATPAVPFAQKHRGLIWAAMALLGLSAMVMIRRQMRKARRNLRSTREKDYYNL